MMVTFAEAFLDMCDEPMTKWIGSQVDVYRREGGYAICSSPRNACEGVCMVEEESGRVVADWPQWTHSAQNVIYVYGVIPESVLMTMQGGPLYQLIDVPEFMPNRLIRHLTVKGDGDIIKVEM